MSRRLTVYARWGEGAVEVTVYGEALEVRAENMEIVFEPRSVIVEAKYSTRRAIADEKKLRVYIDFAEPVKPLKPSRIDLVGSRTLGLFEVYLTDLEFQRYLTVIAPAGFLYNYTVVSDDRLMVEASAKRNVFFEEEPFEKIIVYFT